MIRVIIERRLKARESLAPLLQQLRASAMKWPGYISGESLVSTEDDTIILVISTWRSLEDWIVWETSEVRDKLYQQIKPLLVENPKVSTYKILATEERPH